MAGLVQKDRRRLSLGVRAPEMGDVAGLLGADEGASGWELPGGEQCVVIKTRTDRLMARQRTFSEKELIVLGGTEDVDELKKSLSEAGIGMSCMKGMKPESPNQDSFCIVHGDGFRLYAVFDGHGPLGHDVSEFAAEELPKLFLKDDRRAENPQAALHDVFVQCQRMLERKGPMSNDSGSTCTVAYLPSKDDVWMAHVADSRAVLGSVGGARAILGKDLTTDHKPELEGERKRIEGKGGRVVFDGYFNYRVYSKEGRGGLNMSRALGDTLTHSAGVTEVPEVSSRKLQIEKGVDEEGRDLFIMLCSDGVWEFIPSQEAAEIVKGHGRAGVNAAIKELTEKSYERWMADSEGEVSDDITALIIWL